jgi:hypothetical protein
MVNVVILSVIASNYNNECNYMVFGVMNIIMLNVIMLSDAFSCRHAD